MAAILSGVHFVKGLLMFLYTESSNYSAILHFYRAKMPMIIDKLTNWGRLTPRHCLTIDYLLLIEPTWSNSVEVLKNKANLRIWKLRLAYCSEKPNLGQNRWCFVPCDLEIWWMTLENNRAPLLCCFKLCATFHSHRWIQLGVAVRKRPIWVKFDDF